MTSPDPTSILAQINSARDQTYQNLALLQAQAKIATDAAEAAARDRAAVAAMSQQSVTVDTSVGTRVFAGDVMIFGDTGWRAIDLGLLGSYLYIRREGSAVFAVLQVNEDPQGVAGPNQSITGVVPPGFRPPVTVRSLYGESGSSPSKLIAFGGSNITLYTGRDTTRRADSMYMTYTTKESWPTSLPGTAA